VADNDGVVGDDGQDANWDRVAEEKDRVGLDVEVIKGGAGGDLLTNAREASDTCGALYGGGGDDHLKGGPGDTKDALVGDAGNDLLEAFSGHDYLSGGMGNDIERGGPWMDHFVQAQLYTKCGGHAIGYSTGGDGADVLDGGESYDYVDYKRTDRVEVYIDDAANDGAPGEGDDVYGIETASGGAADDLFVGGGDDDHFYGHGGNDTYDTRGGEDHVEDQEGDDTLSLGDDDDTFDIEDDQVDTLDAGDGHDTGRWDGIDHVTGVEIG
jgi:Ca2+-binding RTX toxin-like protein